MVSTKDPGADGTTRGATEIVQAGRLNTSEAKPTPEHFQHLGAVTDWIVTQLADID